MEIEPLALGIEPVLCADLGLLFTIFKGVCLNDNFSPGETEIGHDAGGSVSGLFLHFLLHFLQLILKMYSFTSFLRQSKSPFLVKIFWQ